MLDLELALELVLEVHLASMVLDVDLVLELDLVLGLLVEKVLELQGMLKLVFQGEEQRQRALRGVGSEGVSKK